MATGEEGERWEGYGWIERGWREERMGRMMGRREGRGRKGVWRVLEGLERDFKVVGFFNMWFEVNAKCRC